MSFNGIRPRYGPIQQTWAVYGYNETKLKERMWVNSDKSSWSKETKIMQRIQFARIQIKVSLNTLFKKLINMWWISSVIGCYLCYELMYGYNINLSIVLFRFFFPINFMFLFKYDNCYRINRFAKKVPARTWHSMEMMNFYCLHTLIKRDHGFEKHKMCSNQKSYYKTHSFHRFSRWK